MLKSCDFSWEDLDFWGSKEWSDVQDTLNKLDKKKVLCNPSRDLLFAALDACPFEKVRVCIIGQDPYPKPKFATGIAFSIPKHIDKKDYPPTLSNIFKEYTSDLHYPHPNHGDLSLWCSQGVLLWNSVCSCEEGKPGSHRWVEWETLTKEIVEKLDANSVVVFILLGAYARNYSNYILSSNYIETSHPSPLGAKSGNNPFFGSRIFTRANALLVDAGANPIDWRLP